MKKIIVKSQHQSGGITAGEISNANVSKKKKLSLRKMTGIATLIMLVLGILTFLGVDKMFDKKNKANEIYNVNSEKQSGGITAGKIENINIITDKESLGIRDDYGLYKDGNKVGTVVNPTINEPEKTFYFEEIQLDKPIPNGDVSFIFSTFEFRKYILKASKANSVVTMLPPGAKGVEGSIIGIRE